MSDIFKAKQNMWETKWSDAEFDPHWGGRGVAVEVIQAIEKGWMPKSGNVLDVGCGDGLMAHWFSDQGYDVSAFDLSHSAIELAKKNAPSTNNAVNFFTHDICLQSIPGGPYNIIVDRGCLHQIPGPGVKQYVQHLAEVSSNDARFLLICAAYRNGNPIGDLVEKQKHVDWVIKKFAGKFKLVAANDTYLDRWGGTVEGQEKGGIAFWLERCPL
jgi:SAM-dependent methyltransferase